MNRIEKAQQVMAEQGIDLLALWPGAHMHWLMGFHPHPDERPCLLLISREKAVFLMPALNAEECRKHCDLPFYEWNDADGPHAALEAALAAIGASKATSIALDETMRADFALLVKDTLAGARHCFTETSVGALRMHKDADEYRSLKDNALINDRALLAGFAALKPGLSELEIAEVIKAHHSSEGATTQFCIIGAGGNGAFPHHATGKSILQAGDAIVMDIGATTGDYQSDMTRMAVLGTPPEGYLEVHAIVEAAVQAALKAAKPGVAAKEVDLAARNVIADAGYGDYFVHRTGHGMGLETHEPPYITSTSQTILEPGMVFSIEPGIYLQGRFGIRLEDIVILREDGPEILSELPRNCHIVEL